MSVVAVVTSNPPFVEGGHLVIARGLVQALRAEGHESDLVLTPQNRFGRQGAAYVANWLTDVGRTHDGRKVDQVISLRYPSYAVRHSRHVCWLLHTMREYYDQWEAFSQPLSSAARLKEQTRRRLVWTADRYLLRRQVKRLFVISATVQRRLQTFIGVPSEVLHPPPPPRPYRVDSYDPYLFAVSRFTPLKRMALIVEALARPEAAGIRAVLAGDGEQHAEIARLVQERGLHDRVSLPGRLDDDGLVAHLARCRAVVFPPFDEDYGFVTVEAFASSKPVITCADSGGPVELVADGVNGLIAAADPGALARAFRRLMDDQGEAVTMGEAGAAVAARLSWPDTVRRLLLPVH